jgi:hypothetical protein
MSGDTRRRSQLLRNSSVPQVQDAADFGGAWTEQPGTEKSELRDLIEWMPCSWLSPFKGASRDGRWSAIPSAQKWIKNNQCDQYIGSNMLVN